MRLRKAFLSKMIVTAMLTTQISGIAHAMGDGYDEGHQPYHPADQDITMYHGHAIPNVPFDAAHMTDAQKAEQAAWMAQYHKQLALNKHLGFNQEFFGFTKDVFDKLQVAVTEHPHEALSTLTKAANLTAKQTSLGMSKFQLSLKYSNALPAGEVSSLELVQDGTDKVNLQLTVHQAVKTNAFFLLDALMELKNIYNLDGVYVGDSKPVYGQKHPDQPHAHAPIVSYQYSTILLNNTLGLPANPPPAVTHGANAQATNPLLRLMTPMELLEVQANAAAGSPFAQRRLAEMDTNTFELIKRGTQTFIPLQKLTPEAKKAALIEYAAVKGVTLSASDTYEVALKKFFDAKDLANKQNMDRLNAQAKSTYSQEKNAYKSKSAVRDAIVNGPALNDMIKANNREGVASSMEQMMPWEIMEPTETKFWRDFIESIRHPDYTNAQIMFRGIDQDEKFQSITDAKGDIVSGGMLSKRLTAGSGSHFFKLRGLPETFETFGTYGVYMKQSISPLTQPHTVTKMMLNHAANPAGSPFISLTYSLDTAYGFSAGTLPKVDTEEQYEALVKKAKQTNSTGGLATVRIDPRRLLINSVSGFSNELEILASMFIFPDEVVYFEKATRVQSQVGNAYKMISVTPQDYYSRARQAVLEKTGIQMPADYQQVSMRGQIDFVVGLKKLEGLYDSVNPASGLRCDKVF